MKIIKWILIILAVGLTIAITWDIWAMAAGWSFFFGYLQKRLDLDINLIRMISVFFVFIFGFYVLPNIFKLLNPLQKRSKKQISALIIIVFLCFLWTITFFAEKDDLLGSCMVWEGDRYVKKNCRMGEEHNGILIDKNTGNEIFKVNGDNIKCVKELEKVYNVNKHTMFFDPLGKPLLYYYKNGSDCEFFNAGCSHPRTGTMLLPVTKDIVRECLNPPPLERIPTQVQQPLPEKIPAQIQQQKWNGNSDVKWYMGNKSAKEFTITTAEQLAGLAILVRDNVSNFKGKTIKLGANIMLNDTINWRHWEKKPPTNKWVPIGGWFSGTFDGNGYTVSGVYINSRALNSQGFFGNIASDGTIENLGVIASYVYSHTPINECTSYKECSNACNKDLQECNNHYDYHCKNIRIGYKECFNNCYNDLRKCGNNHCRSYYVGGLAGNNRGMIKNSYSSVIVDKRYIEEFYHSSYTNCKSYVGRLVGSNTGKIVDSYSTGKVIGFADDGPVAGVH